MGTWRILAKVVRDALNSGEKSIVQLDNEEKIEEGQHTFWSINRYVLWMLRFSHACCLYIQLRCCINAFSRVRGRAEGRDETRKRGRVKKDEERGRKRGERMMGRGESKRKGKGSDDAMMTQWWRNDDVIKSEGGKYHCLYNQEKEHVIVTNPI